MDFISFFGKILEKKTGKKEIACKGVIRLAFRDAGIEASTLKIDDYKKVFSEFLKERFEKSRIDNPADLANHMVSELIKNQGLFTMAS
ncbi:MAG: hypothetical protein GY870_12205 [archaeon]|nr:hypothetical protein [archaeon]